MPKPSFEEQMTSFYSTATPSEIKKVKDDELEQLIAVLNATGQYERAKDLEEVKSIIDDLVKDLLGLVDDIPTGMVEKVFGLARSEPDQTMEVNGYKIQPGANLRGANLEYAKLSQANLTGADPSGVDLTAANLTHANLEGAE